MVSNSNIILSYSLQHHLIVEIWLQSSLFKRNLDYGKEEYKLKKKEETSTKFIMICQISKI